MIRNLSPLLSTPVHNPLLIERLEFRADMQRGDKVMASLFECAAAFVCPHGQRTGCAE